MSIFIGNQDKFLTNSSVHSINIRSKHQLHRPIANLSCFQKGASYSGIRIFNNLPQSIRSLRNEKPQFKVAWKFFLYAYSFYSVDECFACTDDMYYWLIWLRKFWHCNNFICLVCFCMFLTSSTSYCLVTASGIYGMYTCMYVCITRPSTQVMGTRSQLPDTHFASGSDTNVCQIKQSWKQYVSY